MKYSLISAATRLNPPPHTRVIPFITGRTANVTVVKYGNLLDRLMHYSMRRSRKHTYCVRPLISYAGSIATRILCADTLRRGKCR